MSETKTKNLCTVPAADLTDSQYFIAEDGGELKRIPKAQVVLKKLENMLATDTENLAGGGEVTAQELLDALAEQVANKLLAKSQVVNNLLATVEGNPLDATQGKALKELIDTTNNNLSNPDRINLNVLTEITSLNSPERTGVYYVTGNNIGALPPGLSNYGILLCMRSPYSLHPTNSNCVYVQEYTDVYGKHASRSFNNGAWTNWVTTATKDDLLSIDVKKYASGTLSKGSQKEINLTFEPRTGYTRRYFVGEVFGTGSNSVIVNVHG